MKPATKRLLSEAEKYLFICIGLAVFAFGWTFFLIPHQITGGGISGISAIIYFACDKIPVSVSALVLNLILIGIAWKILGRRFCIDTLICSVLLSLLLHEVHSKDSCGVSTSTEGCHLDNVACLYRIVERDTDVVSAVVKALHLGLFRLVRRHEHKRNDGAILLLKGELELKARHARHPKIRQRSEAHV